MQPIRGEAIRLENVWITYSGAGKPAIRNINLSIPSGVLTLIKGPNGAGKTTLIETCLGLLKPIKGNAYLLGINTKDKRIFEVRRKCSYVPQDFMKPPYEHYTAKKVIEMGLSSNRVITDPLPDYFQYELEYYAKELDVLNLLEKPIGILSGGQQQKVFIIRALIRRPKLLFLDEPFSSLDKESREKVTEIVVNYIRKHKDSSAIIVSHSFSKIEKYADIVVTMNNGVITDIKGR